MHHDLVLSINLRNSSFGPIGRLYTLLTVTFADAFWLPLILAVIFSFQTSFTSLNITTILLPIGTSLIFTTVMKLTINGYTFSYKGFNIMHRNITTFLGHG